MESASLMKHVWYFFSADARNNIQNKRTKILGLKVRNAIFSVEMKGFSVRKDILH